MYKQKTNVQQYLSFFKFNDKGTRETRTHNQLVRKRTLDYLPV